jgi:hypothetical protein
MTQALLALDTDRIKEYVFATGALRDIRGASAILDDLNRRRMPRLVQEAAPGATTVYAHGGSGLFVVEHHHAAAAQLAVQREYARATECASVSGAIAELPATGADGDIHSVWRLLAHRLRSAKDRNPEAAELTSHPLMRPCEACGTRCSAIRWSGPEGEQRICGSCNLKRERDKRIRDHDIPGWLRNPTAAGEDAPLWERLLDGLRGRSFPLGSDLTRPEDFDKLAAISRPEGYMGLIYADGDGIGRELEQLRALSDIERFARAVDGAAQQAVVTAIARHLQPSGDTFPFDVLLLGGDDVVLVTAADRALDAALTLVETFSKESEVRLGRALRLSATVVLAHARYPFAALLKLAEGGLALAKRQAADGKLNGNREGLINFLVLSSTNHLDFEAYLDRVLRARPPNLDVPIDRTLRPYTTAGFKRLLQAARTLAVPDVPRSRVQQLRQACFLDHLHGRLEAEAALLRWRDSDAKHEPVRLVNDFAGPGTVVQFPWFWDGPRKVWRTPLADAIEILDFVTPGESHA